MSRSDKWYREIIHSISEPRRIKYMGNKRLTHFDSKAPVQKVFIVFGYDKEKKLLPHFPVSRIEQYKYMFLWPETKIQQMLPINLFIDTFGHRLFDSATFFVFLLPFIFIHELYEKDLGHWTTCQIIQKIIQSENINFTKNCFVTFENLKLHLETEVARIQIIFREKYGLWSVWIIYIIALCFHYIQKSAWRSSDIQFHWRQLDYFHLRIYYMLAIPVLHHIFRKI